MGAVEFFQQQPVVIDAVPVLSLNSLPLGFRFRPTDEELIDFYLRQKINGKGDDVWVIREIDVCKWEPWDLPDLSVVRNKDPEWFFFCPQDRKYPNGLRLNRATSHGYWKATGKDRKIKSGSTLIGMKKTLVFYTGRAPKGNRTNWVMHEYRPTLKELDGTNPGQSPYVLCRLFKKQDESLESPNGGEVERTTSTPTTANYSPEEIQSDPTLNPVSSSQATEDDRQLAVVPENSEEAMSNIIIPVDCHSDGYDEQNQAVEPSMEDAQLLNMDIFYDPTEQFDDKFFSPVNMHILPEFNYQSNNESNGQCGVQHQYGTNETDMSEFFNSVVNWDDILYEESSSQTPNSACFDVKGSGSWINSDVGMTDTMHLQAFDASYAGEPIDTKIPLVTTKEFNAMTSNLSGNELQSNIGVFENHSHMPFSTDVSMGQVYNAASDYEQQRNFNMSGGTGIRIRPRQGRHEEPKMNPVMQSQGTAPRRIRLQRFVVHSHSSDETAVEESCASEYHNSKLATAGETKASGDHAAGESDSVTNDTEETSPELGEIILNRKQGASRKTSSVFATSDEVSSCASEDDASEDHYPKLTAAGERKASEDHASGESATVSDDADELDVISCKLAARKMSRKQLVGKAKVESFSALSETLLSRRVSYTSKSKASSNLGMWSSVFAVSATVLVLMALVFLVNPWGYLKSLKCILGYYSFCT